jgi:hypothetical protein
MIFKDRVCFAGMKSLTSNYIRKVRLQLERAPVSVFLPGRGLSAGKFPLMNNGKRQKQGRLEKGVLFAGSGLNI